MARVPGRRPTGFITPWKARGTRRGKMNHILEAASRKESESIRNWLESLVEDGTVAASAAAIRTAYSHTYSRHDLAGSGNELEAANARKARIVLTESNVMVEPTPGSLFRRFGNDGLKDDFIYVDARLSEDSDLVSSLEFLGIRESDNEGRFRSVLDQGFLGYTDDLWERFWELLNKAGVRARRE